MSDVTCRICGEPWDTWGAQTGEGDLTRDEYRVLLLGAGCPHCEGHPDCVCGHTWLYHTPRRGSCHRYNPHTSIYDPIPVRCSCKRYVPGPAHDDEHYGSIEGEDAEAWEVLQARREREMDSYNIYREEQDGRHVHERTIHDASSAHVALAHWWYETFGNWRPRIDASPDYDFARINTLEYTYVAERQER